MSSLANKDPNNAKSLLFRQIELNWMNAPLEDSNDYIGLYLDAQPDENALPVSVHKLNGEISGHIISDFYLPTIDFYNRTAKQLNLPQNSGHHTNIYKDSYLSYADEPTQPANVYNHWQATNRFGRIDHSDHLTKRLLATQQSKLPQLTAECVGYCIAYHSRNKILAKNCLKTQPNWMRDSFQYISARSLPMLMIPGTHNSGTYPKQLDKSVLQIINKYQMNQDESIYNQLVYGIRHLDLRVGYTKVKQRSERLWIYHDIFRTDVSVTEVLEQVRRFLDSTSHEIVVMDFHRFTVGFQNENVPLQRERHAKMIELIFRHLADYIVPSYLGQHAPINEYVAMGKRLIVGYASRSALLGSHGEHSMFGALTDKSPNDKRQQVRDIDAIKQDYEDSLQVHNGTSDADSVANQQQQQSETVDRRMGTRIYNKLKSLKLISNSFSKRTSKSALQGGKQSSEKSQKLLQGDPDLVSESQSPANEHEIDSMIAKVALFFPPVRHLWPNKDTLEGLAQFMNETTCRKYFGEFRSMMVELTPTVFGAISDKYDGNRPLAQLVNRHVTDWIRDRWLHCINIVSSDYFLGNDLIRLSIYANKMRLLHKNVDLNDYGQCDSFRRIEHLLDKSKIPIQFAYQHPSDSIVNSIGSYGYMNERGIQSQDSDLITHTSADGNQILLKPLTSNQWTPREKRGSFVENVSDGFSDLFTSFKRFFNL